MCPEHTGGDRDSFTRSYYCCDVSVRELADWGGSTTPQSHRACNNCTHAPLILVSTDRWKCLIWND